MSDESPRVTPLPPKEWPESMRDALAALTPPNQRHPFPPRDADRPKGLNVLGTLARYPELTRAYHTFNGHVQFATTLSTRQRELIILRVAVLRNCEYEWAQHVVIGSDVGLTDEEIERIGEGPEVPGWTSVDRALLAAVDELIVGADLSEPTWQALAEEFDEQQLMDLIFTVGAYDVLAMMLRSFRIPLDDDLRR